MVKAAVDESLRPKARSEIKPKERVGTVGFADPAVIDPTTGKPYLSSSVDRQMKEIRRQEETLTVPNQVVKKIEEPVDSDPVRKSPIDKILELGYLMREKTGPKGAVGKIISGLDETNPNHVAAIEGFFETAVGQKMDAVSNAWCAAFVNHILTELSADILNPDAKLGSEKSYARIRADDYLNYGSPVESLADAKEGDLILFNFSGGKKPGVDHVTFFAGNRLGLGPAPEGRVNVIGGNQFGDFTSGEVSIREGKDSAAYSVENIVGIRRITYDDIDFNFTKELAEKDVIFKTFIPSEVKKYYNKGGLTQTEQAFNVDAEGRRRRADRERRATTLKDAATFVASATPIIGDVMAAKEVYDELQKDDPNYFLVGALGGAAIVGLVPGLGDVAASAIRAGARKALDTAKRVEVDPTALGSMGGNIRLKPKENADIAQAENLLDDPDALKSWQNANKLPETQRQSNPFDSTAAAQELFEGKITSKEARKRISKAIPAPQEYTAEQVMNMMPTVTQITGSLGKKANKFGILGVKGFDLQPGQKVSSRLDINSYNNYNTWVVSIHDGTKDAGSVVGFGQAIRLKNIRFGSKSKEALDIARGKRRTATGEDKLMGKSTIARIFGEYVPENPYSLQKQAADIIASGSDEWTQVGMNPYRGSSFYSKKDGMPVFEADEIIQVGPLALAKNVKKPTISQMKEMKIKTADSKIRIFNKGGTAMNRQMEMAFMQQGGLKDDGMKVDPVSGNEIPPGSLAKEVRDDIPAQLSEGEYVVPADVVQYYGVKHFEDLRDKAKGALQQMERDGRIGGEPVPVGGPKAGPAGQMMKQQPPPMPPKPPATSGMTQATMPPAPKQMAMGGSLTGEEMQEIRKMANGGMVQMADPYQQQKAMYQQPQGMALGGSPFIPNIGTGFSWEATGPGSITPQPPKQVTLYGPNGEVENLILPADQTKYDTLIAQGYTETAPVTPVFTSSRSKDDSPEPPKPKPWYETTDFTAGTAGGKASATKYFGTEGKIGSVVGGIAGSIFGGPVGGAIGSYGIKVSNLASARAEVTLRKAMGDANGANALQKAIDNQLKTSKALGYADDAIDAVFGSDGDMKVISALQAAGIKVDRSLRDDDLDDFMDNLSSNDKDKLIDRYGDKKTTPIVSTPKSEKPTPTVDTSGDPRGEPDRDDRPRPPSPIPSPISDSPDESTGGGGGGSTSGGGVSSGDGGGSYGGREDTSDFGGSTGTPGGRNKGGLMQRK